jgi:thiamine phosphate synthase YjbQ (UPF0047 family)
MIFLKNYFVNTSEGVDVISTLHEINRSIRESGIVEGTVNVIVPEAGGGLAVMEPLPDVIEGFKEAVRAFPGDGVETKNRRKEEIDVGPRVAAAMLGRTLAIPLHLGRLCLGHREEPVIVDLERGGRRREFFVQVVGEPPPQAAPAGRAQPQRRR